MTTRRDFLLGTTGVVAFGAGAPAFLHTAAAQAARGGPGNILVVVQLSGGNDGLNTVIPYGDDAYLKARPKLRFEKDAVLKIDDRFGFHPSLRGFADLLEAGRLAVLHGVGYPSPNRSHFESMDIWHNCSPKGKEPRLDGWLGRYLDAHAREAGQDVPALHLGGEQQPLALAAKDVRTPSVSSLDRFRLQGADKKDFKQAIKELTDPKRPGENALLDFVQSSTVSALSASERVEGVTKSTKPGGTYPGTDLARKLQTVAQLIDAGLATRIYYVTLDGFDTHSQQPAAHAGLMEQFGGAVKAFCDDLAKRGHLDRTAVMGFSEFGRRVAENASEGTDHGAAGPMFLAGGRVKAGLIGKHPSLTDLDDGDLKHNVDFRQVYATMLEQWLGVKSAPLLGGEYKPVEALRSE